MKQLFVLEFCFYNHKRKATNLKRILIFQVHLYGVDRYTHCISSTERNINIYLITKKKHLNNASHCCYLLVIFVYLIINREIYQIKKEREKNTGVQQSWQSCCLQEICKCCYLIFLKQMNEIYFFFILSIKLF